MEKIFVYVFEGFEAAYIVSVLPLLILTGIEIHRYGLQEWSPFLEQFLYAIGNLLEQLAFGLSWILPIDQVYEQPIYFVGTQLSSVALLNLINKLAFAQNGQILHPFYACKAKEGRQCQFAKQLSINLYPQVIVVLASVVGAIWFGSNQWYQFILSICASCLAFYVDILVIVGVVRLKRLENKAKSSKILFLMACIALVESIISHCVSILIPWLLGSTEQTIVFFKDWFSLSLSIAILVIQYIAIQESKSSLKALQIQLNESFGEYVA